MNVVNLFLEAAEKYPDNIAIIDGDQRITYRELKDEVYKTSQYFLEKGIKSGDRILVFVPMGIDLYRIVLAMFNIGATAVFLDEWVTKGRMELCCEIAQCNGFIGNWKARILSFVSKALWTIPIHLHIKGRSESKAFTQDLDRDAAALITFTTGTTGRPKAANRTHEFFYEQFKSLNEEIDPQPSDIDMPVLPIVLFVNLGIGCTSVIAEFKSSKQEKMDSDKIVKQIQLHKVQRIISSPFFIERLAQHCLEKKIVLRDLIEIYTGGAAVFPKMALTLRNAFPEANINVVYGSTEVEPISTISVDELIVNSNRDNVGPGHDNVSPGHDMDLQTRNREIGLPVGTIYHLTQIKIIKIDQNPISLLTEQELSDMEVNEGEIGEIIVAGPHVLKSYYNSEEAFLKSKIITDSTIWHRTGDSGRMIGDQLYLTGRCSNLIYRGDEILSPFVIEEQLGDIEGITCGTLIERNGKLVLVLESSLTQNEVSANVDFIPFDEIRILQRIPRDPRHHSRIDYARI